MLDGVAQDLLECSHHLLGRAFGSAFQSIKKCSHAAGIQQVAVHLDRDPVAIRRKHLNARRGILRFNRAHRIPCNLFRAKGCDLAEKNPLAQRRNKVLWCSARSENDHAHAGPDAPDFLHQRKVLMDGNIRIRQPRPCIESRAVVEGRRHSRRREQMRSEDSSIAVQGLLLSRCLFLPMSRTRKNGDSACHPVRFL